MKSCKQLCVLALATIAGAASVQAAQTNLVQNLTFKLTAWSQGSTVTNGNIVSVNANAQSIVTKDIIGWLGTATTNNFVNAQLLIINQFGIPDAKSHIVVRTIAKISKTQSTTNNVDVSNFFAFTAAPTVNNYSYNLLNNAVNPGTYYGYWTFYLLKAPNYPSPPVTFIMTGLGIDSAVNIVNKKKMVLGIADQFSITNAAGMGIVTVNSNAFIIGGNIVISGKTLEVNP